MLREYAVQATVVIYVGAQSSDDAVDEAWDDLIEMGLTPVSADVIGPQ